MSELTPIPEPAPPPATAPRRRRIVLVAVAAVAVLAVAIAVTAIVILGRERESQHRYKVTVLLTADVTAEEKAAVESALRGLHPVDGVRFESREQAWAKFQEDFKDHPDLVATTKAEYLPESFHLVTAGRVSDCAALAQVRELPGVDEIVVVQAPTKERPGTKVRCP